MQELPLSEEETTIKNSGRPGAAIPYSIWAPAAKTVALVLEDRRIELRRDDGKNTWSGEVRGVAERGYIPYKLSIDDENPIPDPFSRWQPEGVHGRSHLRVDPLTPPTPLGRQYTAEELVIYEMHVGTFTAEGTYRSAESRLPHLIQLGITHIELMPLAAFPGSRGWGYDGTFLFAPHASYGTPEELRDFISACHEAGLGVLLDVVYNHLGPDGNYLPRLGPCFAKRNKTLWGDTLNFDEPGNEGIRRLIIDNATLWLRDYGFDGLRLDAVHGIHDSSGNHILRELTAHVRQLERSLDRKLLLIAESDLNDPKLVHDPSIGGFGLDAFWADDFHHAIHGALTGESRSYYGDFHGVRDIARALREGYIYQGQFSEARKKLHGVPATGIAMSQCVFCIQNHDQIGNRARGDRIGQLLDPIRQKSAAAVLILSPAIPMLFQGEEWNAQTPFLYFTDHHDPQLAKAVTEGRLAEFSTETNGARDPQDSKTFEDSRLNWDELNEGKHSDHLQWYLQLLALRRALPSKACTVECDENAGWLSLSRPTLHVSFNFSLEQRVVPRAPRFSSLVLSSDTGTESIPPGGVRIYRA